MDCYDPDEILAEIKECLNDTNGVISKSIEFNLSSENHREYRLFNIFTGVN